MFIKQITKYNLQRALPIAITNNEGTPLANGFYFLFFFIITITADL